MSTKELTLPSEDMCGEPRLSAQQPKHTGFGFVIHLPASVCTGISIAKIKALLIKGMIAKESQPIFMRTERKFVRLTFNYGDSQTAQQAYDLFSLHTKLIFKNWI